MASTLPVYQFDPKYTTDIDSFTFNLAAWVGDDDELSGTPTATISPSSATISSIVTADNMVTVWVSGGTNGAVYTISLRVLTATGRDCHIRGQFKAII